LPSPVSALLPESPLLADWLERLQTDITVIKVELRDDGAQQHCQEQVQKQGQRLIELGRRMLHRPGGGETLHAALDAYARWIRSKYLGVDKAGEPPGPAFRRTDQGQPCELPDPQQLVSPDGTGAEG
jgi:hypothetical protein